MRHVAVFVLLALTVTCLPTQAQVPQPFPRPVDQKPGAKVEPPARPGTPTDQAVSSPAPTEAMLGVPIYPTAQFIATYDAGRGQQYHLFGTNSPFTQIVEYYKAALKQRGELIFDEPPVHMFEVGRFREETMSFPPGVTVKDYAWAGSIGYLNPKRGAEPARFKTIIQIVPVVPGAK